MFSILGTVDAFTSLECEVVYQPTFSAPEETDFLVHVTGGSDLKLKCIAKVHVVFKSLKRSAICSVTITVTNFAK